ncbi:MAG: hypothetical protein RLZZ09_831 [Pseudomonadota bacterium]|jgi:hypothetical protein
MLFRLTAALLPLAVGACAQSVSLPQPSTIAPAIAPTSVATPTPSVQLVYTARPVTEPTNWRALNDRQAPGGDQ